MNKVVITNKEINKIANTRLKGILGKYKEEEYKEVFISDNQVFIYDIYIKDWLKLWVVAKTIFEFKEGFYNYSIVEEAIPLFKNLDKDKIYMHKVYLIDNKDFHIKTALVYNKELEVWEEIFIDSTNKIEVINRRVLSYMKERHEGYLTIVDKKEFDIILLTNELVS